VRSAAVCIVTKHETSHRHEVFDPKKGKILIYADMNPYKRRSKNYVYENKNYRKKIASNKRTPFFTTKCHCQLLVQVLQINKPEKLQDLELLK